MSVAYPFRLLFHVQLNSRQTVQLQPNGWEEDRGRESELHSVIIRAFPSHGSWTLASTTSMVQNPTTFVAMPGPWTTKWCLATLAHRSAWISSKTEIFDMKESSSWIVIPTSFHRAPACSRSHSSSSINSTAPEQCLTTEKAIERPIYLHFPIELPSMLWLKRKERLVLLPRDVQLWAR